MMDTNPKTIETSLLEKASELFGSGRAKELQPELEIMSQQISLLRNTPVELMDEP